MSGLLTRAGYEPIVAEDMEAAKQEVAKLSPGAVIVSAMKFRNGTAKELINWLKEEGYKFPLLAVVDNLNPMELIDVMCDWGAVNVIQRPAIDKQLLRWWTDTHHRKTSCLSSTIRSFHERAMISET